MLANDNYLDGHQDIEFNGTIIIFIKEFKEDTKEQLNDIKQKEFTDNKRVSAVPKKT